MSVVHIREELVKLQEEVDSVTSKFTQDTYYKQYYLMEASPTEEDYWTKVFQGIKSRAELISLIWEAEVLSFQLVNEENPPSK